jgi:hypothetical protein
MRVLDKKIEHVQLSLNAKPAGTERGMGSERSEAATRALVAAAAPRMRVGRAPALSNA